jgi:SAM-dependent methyltransferase
MKSREYWNELAGEYQEETFISTDDFHYGPMIPGDGELKLLPRKLRGIKSLEIGCGAAQNSVYLAKKGAVCTAFDIAEMQLAVALDLIRREKVKIQLYRFSMDSSWSKIEGTFDLIHSTFGLCFSKHPEKIIKKAASLLNDGGTFIFSLEHPVAASEKLELEGDRGVFINDYFNPIPEVRVDEDDNEIIRSETYPVGIMSEWISKAGLTIQKIVEPKPRIIDTENLPYVSEAWQESLAGFEGVPPVIIFLCRRSA